MTTSSPTRCTSSRRAITASTSTTPSARATAASPSTRQRKPDDASIAASASPEFDSEGRYLEAQFGNLSVISLYLPSGSAGAERQASKFRFLDAFVPYLRGCDARAARLRHLRRLEHRAPGHRPEELALEPEELRLPARGARLARPAVRRARLRRRVPRGQPEAGPVHVVVEPRPGPGEERRLAHRLPGCEQIARAARRARRTSIRTGGSPITRR